MRRNERNIVNTVLSTALFALVFLHNIASSETSTSTHDTLRVCDGDTATFSWPCDLAYDLARVMTLTFNGFSNQDQVIATIDSTGKVTIPAEYSNRVTTRGTTGIRLENVRILDSGSYLTTATFANGTVIKRKFTLNVRVPPLLKENRLKMVLHSSSPKCHTLTCGSIVFPGFPAVAFHWQTPKGNHAEDPSEGASTLHGCPLLPGNYTCQVISSALACGQYHAASSSVTSLSASLMLSAKTVKEIAASEAENEDKELILMIMIPIVAVMTPLIILGVWLLSHFLSDVACCGDDDSETGLLNGSSPPAAARCLATLPQFSESTPDPAPSPPAEPEGEGQKEEGDGAEDDEEKDVDDDTADPMEPLLDPEFSSPIDLDIDNDGDETRL